MGPRRPNIFLKNILNFKTGPSASDSARSETHKKRIFVTFLKLGYQCMVVQSRTVRSVQGYPFRPIFGSLCTVLALWRPGAGKAGPKTSENLS